MNEATDKLANILAEYFKVPIDIPCPYCQAAEAILKAGWLPPGSFVPVQLEVLTDEEIIGDFCKTCDFSLEGCIEQGQQVTCKSYREALKQKRQVSQATIAHNLKGRQLYRKVPAPDSQGESDICVCGHNIHEHEAVHECRCYVYGCNCQGFEPQ